MRIGLALDPRDADAEPRRLLGRKRDRRDQEAALLQGLERPLEGVTAHHVEDDAHVFDSFLKGLLVVVRCYSRL